VRRLEGKVAIVAGGATGLGRVIAERYAEEGAKVVVGDMRPDEGQATADALGGDARFVQVDVTDGEQVRALVAAAEDAYGRLDIMTANAGILGRCAGQRLEDADEADLGFVMEVNYGGVMRCFKYAAPAIRRAGGGAMTATGSIAAHRGLAQHPAYCASKAAVAGLVRALAADLAPVIRVNVVSPGKMTTDLRAHTAELKGVEDIDGAAAPVEDGGWRTAAPVEVANAHLFLVSDEASYISGQSLVADGGWTVVPSGS